jgi:acyl-CoA synthetase (AMP-forming)/AMP-acid ligase II
MLSATIFTTFAQAAAAAGDRSALTMPGGVLTFAQLRRDVVSLAGHLGRAAPGGPVALLSEMPQHLLTAFLACAALGRPALILDPARSAGESRQLAERYGAALFAIDARFAKNLPAERSLRLDEPHALVPIELPTVSSEAEFYWGQTSGTTGEPKLFARSHRSWLETFRVAEQVFAFPPAAKVLIPGPLSHSLFLYGAIHALCRGHTAIVGGTFRPDRAAAAAATADCAYVVPAMLAEMLDHGLSGGALRLIFCGGAKLPDALRQRCEAALPAADLIEFYGASETSFITYASTCTPASAGSVGRAFPGVRIAIGDPSDRAAMPAAEGLVHVTSPMLFSRYVGGAVAATWFTAGDIGFLDADGFLHLTGRAGRIINSRALKIRPEPIEAALMELPEIARAAVVDLPDATRGAIAVAAIEFAPGGHLARHTLSRHCRERLGARFSPRRYYAVESLPLTRSGKIALPALRQALMAGSEALRELR